MLIIIIIITMVNTLDAAEIRTSTLPLNKYTEK